MAHVSTRPALPSAPPQKRTRTIKKRAAGGAGATASQPSLRPRTWARTGTTSASLARPPTAAGGQGVPVLVASLFAAALVTAAVVFLVWVKMVQVQAGYRIHELQREVVDLRQERSALEVEVSALRRPDRLDRVGRERLGLFPPRPDQILRLPAPAPASSGAAAAAPEVTP